MALQPVADLLRQLKGWQADRLIDAEEYSQTCEQILDSLSFPPHLDCDVIKDYLKQLSSLVNEELLSKALFKKKKKELLAMIRLDRQDGKEFRRPPHPPSHPLPTNAVEFQAVQQKAAAARDRCASASSSTVCQGTSENVGDKKYFGYYADFAHQELMLNDCVRTSTYQQAIFQNKADFEGKVVIDVGTGTGILSMFAAQAGARKVYAVEASDMAHTAEKIIAHNRLSHIIQVVKGKVEEVEVPEQADIIISEPLGFWLFNEQMIQSYVAARDRWLKPGGKMFPCHSIFYIAPCYVPETRKATLMKSASWLTRQDFYGLDFTCAEVDCQKQHLERMVVDQVFPCQVVAQATAAMVDFTKITVAELNDMVYPFAWETPNNVLWDAIGFWYDTFFIGSGGGICLSTRPDEKLTCWYQTLCLFPEPMLHRSFKGFVSFTANSERTYDVSIYGGPTQEEQQRFLRSYGFTLPVYRYYDHFQDLIWDITQYPDLQSGKISPSGLVAGAALANGIPIIPSYTGLAHQPAPPPPPIQCPISPPPQPPNLVAAVEVTSIVPPAPNSNGISASFSDLCNIQESLMNDPPDNKRPRKETPPPASPSQPQPEDAFAEIDDDIPAMEEEA